MPDAKIYNLLLSKVQSAAASLRVRSALNPALWLCALITLPCFVIAYFADSAQPITTTLLCLGASPIAATIIGFFYFMIFAPEKLQSEDYQIRHETPEFIKQKGLSVEIEPTSLAIITNAIQPAPPCAASRFGRLVFSAFGGSDFCCISCL